MKRALVPFLTGRPAADEYSQLADLVFRVCFSLIFILLGGEHLFRDTLIQGMMPEGLPWKRAWSIATGLAILCGGGCIMLGLFTRIGATALLVFLVPVTIFVHFHQIGAYPETLPSSMHWLWNVYHQGSVLKNLALIGAAIHFAFDGAGPLSLDHVLFGKAEARGGND